MLFSKILIRWYSNNKRKLPWRETREPYYIWLSEIILQQTQVKQGLPYYESFVKHFPTVFDLANAHENEVLKLWQGLGYYSRARNLHATAKYVVAELQGQFPDTYNGLLKLKGVGDYTASAIASICFNEPAAVVDGNVYRVLSRYYGLDTPINSTTGKKQFKELAQEVMDRDDPATYNQAIMEFGARQCRPQNPDCSVCPLQTSCLAFEKDLIKELPVKLKLQKIKKKHFNFLVIQSFDRKTILEQRQGKGIWQNLYQFPLFETKTEATQELVLNYVKQSNLGVNGLLDVTIYNDEDIVHKLSHQHLYTRFWIVRVEALTVKGISIERLRDYPVPILIGNFIERFNFD